MGFALLRHSLKTLLALFALLTVSACVGYQIDSSITKYNAVADRVQLGDSRNKVLSILNPTQKGIPQRNKKNPEKYIKNNVLVEIYYFRTGRQPDNLTTDDEFTPYLFNNGKLVAIGWQVLGGPKSVGQVTSTTQGGKQGRSFMCKDAISRGDSGSTFIFC